jgi:hypothetical protein
MLIPDLDPRPARNYSASHVGVSCIRLVKAQLWPVPALVSESHGICLGTPQRWACKEIGYRIAGCFPSREDAARSLGELLFLYGDDMRCGVDGKES